MDTIEEAAQILKHLETAIDPSSYEDEWKDLRSDFISTVDKGTQNSDLSVLLKQLRHLERYVKKSKKTDSWNQWKRQYWMVITNPNIKIEQSVTQFLLSWMLMEENLLPEAYCDSWKHIRDEVLQKCTDLMDYDVEMDLYEYMFSNVEEVLRQFKFKSLKEYEIKANLTISRIKSAADILDSSTKSKGKLTAVGGGMSITSGGLCVGALFAAPFTGGLSLGLTVTGILVGMGSTATTVTSSYLQSKEDKKTKEHVEDLENLIVGVTLALTEVLENNKTAVLKSCTEGAKVSRSAVRASAEGVSNGIATVSTASTAMSVGLSGLSIGIGVWEAYNGIKKANNGSELSKQFRDLADNLAKAVEQISLGYSITNLSVCD